MRKLAVFFIFGAMLYAGSPKPPKISADLLNINPSSTVNVIVQWKNPLKQDQDQKILNLGGKTLTQLAHIKAGKYSVPAFALAELALDPNVAFISPDRPVKAKFDYSSTVAAVNANTAWDHGFTGAGVTVAVIDSGVNASPELGRKTPVVYNEDFTGTIPQSANVQDPKNGPDHFGHGQHVAGIIASNAHGSSCGHCFRQIKGIAPDVKIVNLRALDDNGIGSDSSVIAAISRAIELKDTYDIKVINLSIGRPVYDSYTVDPLCQAVEQAWKAGIVVVVAAGNDGRDNSMSSNGYGTIDAPGNDPYVITVGAMKTMDTNDRTDDRIATYSSKGPSLIDHIVKPDIVAPGNQVVSLLADPHQTLAVQNPSNMVPVSYYQDTNNAKQLSPIYFTLSGTSMATPVVTGAVADLLQAHPNLTPDQVKARLMLTAYKTFPTSSTATDPTTGQSFVSYYDAFTIGAGYLDIAAALANTDVASGTAQSPSAVFNILAGTVDFQADPTSTWYLSTLTGSRFTPENVWSNTIGSANPLTVGGLSVGLLNATRCTWNLSTDDAKRSMWNLSTNEASVTASRSMWNLNTDDASRSMWNLNTDAANRSMWNLNTDEANRSMWNLSTTSAESITTTGEN